MLKDDDLTLVGLCKNGDRAAFKVLAARYLKPIYNAAYRVLGNVDDANDITQVVFVRVMEHLDEYDPQYRFFSWIYRIAINESINLLRRKEREQPLEGELDLPAPGGSDPESQLHESQTAARVQRALMSMKTEDRVVLMLRHFSECSYRDIAEILNVEEKTVKSRLFEGRQRLAAMLENVVSA